MTARLARARLVPLGVAVAAVLAWTSAGGGSRIAGSYSGTITSQQGLPIPDAPGHVVTLVSWTGTNRSTGPTEYMSGAHITNIESGDLTQGNGIHQGYVTFANQSDTVISRWSGKVTTVLGADQRPITTFEGTWTKVAGTGRFRGASGHGSYNGHLVSPTESAVEWRGELDNIKLAGQ